MMLLVQLISIGVKMEKFKWIQQQIVEALAQGTLKKGDKLMSVREGAKFYGASPATVLKAYEGLIDLSLVHNLPRKGYYIIDAPIQRQTEDFVDFCSPNPSGELLPFRDFKHCVNAALNKLEHSVFQYADPLGLLNLREAVAQQLTENQVFVSSEEIAITSGSQQGIDILFKMTYPGGGKVIMLEQPTYPGAMRAAENNRQEVVFVERTREGLDLDKVETLFRTKDVKCFYLMPRFHNPTGHSLDVTTRKRLYELACQYNVYLIEDDYLVDMDNCNKLPPIKHFDTQGRVIYLKSFSKVFMPGLRLGAMVLPRRMREAFKTYKQWSDISTNALSQGALEVYLTSGMFKEHLVRARRAYVSRIKVLKALVASHGDSRIQPMFLEGSILGSLSLASGIHSDQLQRALEAHHIAIGDTRYGFHPYYQQNNLLRVCITRVGIETIEKSFPQLLDEVSIALDKGYEVRRSQDFL